MHALRPLALLCVRVAALQRAEIIAAPSARELERVAPQLISDGDSVLCAGLALGSQIEMLKRLAGRVVSVDVPRKESRSRRELFQSDAADDVRPLTRAGDVTAALRPDECFICVVVDAAALLGFDLPLDTLALCEALVTMKAAGMDLVTTYEAIRISSGTSFVHETESQVILNGSRDINFTMDLVQKDIGLFQSVAERHGVPLEISPLMIEIFRDGAARFGARAQSDDIIRRLEEATGLDITAPGFPAEMVDDEPEEPGYEVRPLGRA